MRESSVKATCRKIETLEARQTIIKNLYVASLKTQFIEVLDNAYYIANVNIESVYHALAGTSEYLHYDNIILADTFNITEDKAALSYEELEENNERILRQQKAASA